jgi:hypothetical protein
MRRHGATSWLRRALIVACAVAFAVGVVRGAARRTANTEDGYRAIDTALAIAAGEARWGLTNYTHHPMGSAYLLLPAVRLELNLRSFPVFASALAGAIALALLLRLAPWALWPGVLLSFAALLQQPGYIDWVSNTWQHSWNLVVVFVLIALGCTLARAIPWLLLTGYVAGWIGYDFIFAQVATLVAVRIAFWSQATFRRVSGSVLDETAAFLTGFALAVLSHLAQNVLYFSSAVMAVTDLFGSALIRVNNSHVEVPTLATRLQLLSEISGVYLHTFLRPSWSHWPSLLGAAIVTAIGAVAAWRRERPRRRVVLPAVLIGAAAVGGMVGWWTVAPGHALPHLHFFPRLLLVPLLALLAGMVRLLAISAPPQPRPWRLGWHHALAAGTFILLQPPLLHWAAARVDERVYTHAFATTDSAPRSDRLSGAFIPAVSPQAPGPVALKTGWPLVGGVNTWALNLDDGRWEPKMPGPWVYEAQFAQPSLVDEVLVRFPTAARRVPTMRDFTIELRDARPPTRLHRSLPQPEAVDVGFLRCLRYRLDPPVVASGLRLTVRDAMPVPVLYDLLAFGQPAS